MTDKKLASIVHQVYHLSESDSYLEYESTYGIISYFEFNLKGFIDEFIKSNSKGTKDLP